MTLKSSTISARIDGSTKAKLDVICFNSGVSVSKAVQMLVQNLDINHTIQYNE